MPNILADMGPAVSAFPQMQAVMAQNKLREQAAVAQNYQLAEMSRKEQTETAPIPLDLAKAKYAPYPTMQKEIFDRLQAQPGGITTTNGQQYTNQRSMQSIIESITSDKETHLKLASTDAALHEQDAIQKVLAANQALQEAQASGADPAKIAKLQTQAQAAQENQKHVTEAVHSLEALKQKGTWMYDPRTGGMVSVGNAPGTATPPDVVPPSMMKGDTTEAGKPSFRDDLAIKAGRVGTPGEQPGDKEAKSQLDSIMVAEGQKATATTAGREKAEFNALKSAGVKIDSDTGEVDMATVPVGMKNTASMIASYQLPMPSGGFALRSPYWQAVLGVVRSTNPKFNELEYEARKKAIDAVNSPQFVRMRTNANMLANPPSADPKTGQPVGKSELDKIVEARDKIQPGIMASIAPSLRKINDWDQFVDYQVSDPAMAELKGLLVANMERLGNIYSGGGTVTSDYKMRLAGDFLDPTLDKPAFAKLVETHRQSILRTFDDYSSGFVGGLQGVPLQTPNPATPTTTTKKPTYSEYLSKARKMNPDYTDAEIKQQYDKKYPAGRQ